MSSQPQQPCRSMFREPALPLCALILVLSTVSLWHQAGAVHAASHREGLAPVNVSRHSLSRQGLRLSQLPDGLAGAVRRTFDRRQLSVHRGGADRGHAIANKLHRLDTTFTPQGLKLSEGTGSRRWTWGMTLVAYGRRRLEGLVLKSIRAHGVSAAYRSGSVIEWYRNGPQGLEQGFALRARPTPAGSAPVRLGLRLSGTLRPALVGQTLAMRTARGTPALTYGSLRVRDAHGRHVAARLLLRGDTVWIVVWDRGAAYPLRVDPYIQQAELNLGSSASGYDSFGYSVALSSDGSTALVGAPGTNVNSNPYAGAAYLFTGGGAWSAPTKLSLGSSALNWEDFGQSVALSSDGSTALVGAPGAPNPVNGTDSGTAYVFTRSSGWKQQAELSRGAKAGSGDAFGSAVSLSANGSTALIGAYGRTVNTHVGAGAAYVFTYSGTWSAPTSLSLGASAAAGDNFGHAVALSGDGGTALVGAWDRTVDNQVDAGAAYVFTGGSGWLLPQATFDLGSSAASNDSFGDAVALNGAGSVALVGAENRTVSGYSGAGAAYVYTGFSWNQETTLGLGANTTDNDAFGESVSLSADGSTALVGGQDPSYNGTSWQYPGAAYAFIQSAGSWGTPSVLSLGASAESGDGFGRAIALNADGTTALVGAYQHTVNNQFGSGAAYVFSALGAVDTGTSTTSGGSASASVGGTGPGTTGSVSVTASGGTGSITVGLYYGNAVSTAPPSGAQNFFDVYLSSDSTFTGVTVVDCDLGGGTTNYWYNGTSWLPVSMQQYSGSSGCVTTTINGTTSPSLLNLGGTPFVAGSSPTIVRIGGLHLVRHGSRVTIHWRMATATGVLGFNLYARRRLNRRLILAHSSVRYAYVVRWPGRGTLSLEVVFTNGQHFTARATERQRQHSERAVIPRQWQRLVDSTRH